MNPALHSPFPLFRFAVRERDWPLAAALARTLLRSEGSRGRLELELERSSSPEGRPSLFALEVLGRILRTVRGQHGPD